MSKRRQDNFTQRVLNKLYSSQPCSKSLKDKDEITKRSTRGNEYRYDYEKEERTTETWVTATTNDIDKSKPVKRKVYTVSLPNKTTTCISSQDHEKIDSNSDGDIVSKPHNLEQIYVEENEITNTHTVKETEEADDSNTNSDETSDNDVKPRKRKRRRKRARDAESYVESGSNSMKRDDVVIDTSQKILTKNQKRKLRKKKQKLYKRDNRDNTEVKVREFTFDPAIRKDHADVKSKDEKSVEVQEFLDSVWDVYSMEVSKTGDVKKLQETALAYENAVSCLKTGDVEEEVLDKLLQIKHQLLLQHSSAVTDSLRQFNTDENIPSDLRHIVDTLVQYWMTEIAGSN